MGQLDFVNLTETKFCIYLHWMIVQHYQVINYIEKLLIHVTPLLFSPVQFQYNCYNKSNEVVLISTNNGNKHRNLMRYKILYIEVYLPLHTCELINIS